jgi:hypothetical protein
VFPNLKIIKIINYKINKNKNVYRVSDTSRCPAGSVLLLAVYGWLFTGPGA